MDVQFIELGELGMGHVAGSQGEQVFVPDPVGFVGDLAETILDGGFRGEHTQLFLGERRILVGGLRGKQEIGFLSVFRLGLRLVFDAACVEDVGDVDFEDKREARERAEWAAGQRKRGLRLNYLTWFYAYLDSAQIGCTMLGMTEKLAQPTLDLPTAFDAWYLPRRPLCCDADYAQLRRRSRADALKHEHIETNPAALVNMLVVDIDAAEGRAMALWEHQGMMPNLVMENPANGHAHAAWVLAAPVCRTDVARLKPLKLARSVTEGLRRSCDGDAGYAGLLMKNPLSGAWSSEITAPDAYALDQLRAALEEHGDMPPASWKRTKRARTQGLGRNCTLFDEARTDAYRYVRKLPDRTAISSEMLREHVRATCHQLNAELFADPLPAREVEDIARSIHKWITTRSRMWRDGAVACEATFIAMQSARGRKGGRENKHDGESRYQKYLEYMKEAAE